MSRTSWLAILGGLLLVAGLVSAWRWPSSEPALPCAPAEVRFVEAAGGQRVARCLPGTAPGPVPAGAAMTLGVKLDLNRLSADELAEVPGISARLARALVEKRETLSGFRDWSDVDAVAGMGPGKLAALQAVAEIRE